MSTQVKPAPSARGEAPRPFLRRWWLAIAVVALAIVGAALWLGRGHAAGGARGETTGAEAAPADERAPSSPGEGVRVEVVHPRRGGLKRTSTQVGTVHAFQHADLYAKVSGYLKWQEVDIGSRAKKGDVLAEIDDPEVVKEAERAEATLAQARAMVLQAQARVETAEAVAKAAESDVAKARSNVASATARRKYRQKELTRYRDLRAREAVPQQVVDEYEDHYETSAAEEHTAEAEVTSAQAELAAARAKVDQAKADLAEARSNVDVASAALAKARVLVGYTKITSPYTGVITRRTFFVGDFVRSASEGKEQPLLTVARTDKMRVVTYVPDRDVPRTDVGDDAVVTLDALPGQSFKGKVARFSYSEEAESRTMRTEVDLENPKGLLREGMYGIAEIILDPDTPNLTIPSGCLAGKSEGGKSSVYVVREGRAHHVPVTLGADNGIRVEVLEGLSADDQVITSTGSVDDDTPVIVEGARKLASAAPAGR